MKPPPNLTDEAAMLKRGRESALYSARKYAIEILRDALTALQSGGEFGRPMTINAGIARDAADRLLTLAAMWDETNALSSAEPPPWTDTYLPATTAAMPAPATTTAANLLPTF